MVTAIHKKLKSIDKYALTVELVAEQQMTIHLKPRGHLKPREWKAITREIEAAGGCYFDENEWVVPRFLSRINLPAPKETPRLYIHGKILPNLVFLADVFRGKRISWKDIEAALKSFRPERRGYSKSTCRDYLATLLALGLVVQTESVQV